MITLRAKRHHKIQDTIYRLQEQRDQAITKLVRIEARLQLALRAKNRAEKRMAKELSPVPVSVAAGELLPAPTPPVVPDPDDGIPDFLKREQIKLTERKDAAAADEIRAEQAELKRTKAQVRAEKKKARHDGTAKQMPLTGREALDYLRTGSRRG